MTYDLQLQLNEDKREYFLYSGDYDPEEYTLSDDNKYITIHFKSILDVWESARSFENFIVKRVR